MELEGGDMASVLREARRRNDWTLVDAAMGLLEVAGVRPFEDALMSLLQRVLDLYVKEAVDHVEEEMRETGETRHDMWTTLRNRDVVMNFTYPPAFIGSALWGVVDSYDLGEAFNFAVADALAGDWQEYTVTNLLITMRCSREEDELGDFAKYMREDTDNFREELFGYLSAVDDHPYGIGSLPEAYRQTMSDWPVEQYIALLNKYALDAYRDAGGSRLEVPQAHKGHLLSYYWCVDEHGVHCTECARTIACATYR